MKRERKGQKGRIKEERGGRERKGKGSYKIKGARETEGLGKIAQ